MASLHRIHILTLLLLILFLSSTCDVYGGRDPPNPNSNNAYNLVPVDSLRPASTCSSDSNGPCSGNSAALTSHRIFVKDQSRVDFINNDEDDHVSSTADSILGFGSPVTVGFGTPEQKQTLILDTGSDLTWVQCKPCSRCYTQDDPIFDPLGSSTFSSTSCSPSCDYRVPYGDNSSSRGEYANDTLTLPDTGTFPNFIFGCGQNNSDGFGMAAGVLGLSKGGLSIVTQLYIGKIFCYCLTPSRQASKGFLFFGLPALRMCQSDANIFTTLLTHPDKPQYYFVDLLAITIGTKRLPVSSFLSGAPNTILDSGTVITRLPDPVYSALRAEFKNLMSAYPAAPPLPPLLDTCYDLSGRSGNVAIPRMMLHFKGADMVLDSSGVIWWEKDSQVMCLAFAGNKNASHLNIIGNTQQKTVGILHNIQENMVEFKANAC